MRICFGFGLNFTGTSHPVMSPTSRWLSGCFDEVAWWALDLLLMSCCLRGCLRGACSLPFYQLFYTHTTHTQKLPFHFPSAPRALYLCTVVVSGLCVAAFGAGAAAQKALIQSLDELQITPLCGAWGLFCSISPSDQGWLESAGSWKAALWVRASSPSAAATAKASGADDVWLPEVCLEMVYVRYFQSIRNLACRGCSSPVFLSSITLNFSSWCRLV